MNRPPLPTNECMSFTDWVSFFDMVGLAYSLFDHGRQIIATNGTALHFYELVGPYYCHIAGAII